MDDPRELEKIEGRRGDAREEGGVRYKSQGVFMEHVTGNKLLEIFRGVVIQA